MNKGTLLPFLIFLSILVFTHCTKKNNIERKKEKPEKELRASSNIGRVKVIHLYKDTVYLLKGDFSREDGEQLIIDPGTLIKCFTAGIAISPGGMILANGTEEDPVVFTSLADMGTQKAGDWQGITITGKSNNNNSSSNGVIDDSSGRLSYVRIEFGALQLRNIGRRTFLENIQVSYAGGQASFKMDGGSCNARNLLSYASSATADFYFTNGYSGGMQSVVAYRHAYFASGIQPSLLAGIYIENNEFGNRAAVPLTLPLLSNITVLGPDKQYDALNVYSDTGFRNAALVTTENARFQIRNSVFSGFSAAGWYMDDAQTAQAVHYLQSEFSFSIVQAALPRSYYLKPGSYGPLLTSQDFRNFMLEPRFHNCRVDSIENFAFEDPLNYNAPNPFPKTNSGLLTGADFSGPVFSNLFFTREPHIGALGSRNWFEGWVNFLPLKTNYNNYK